MSYTFGSGFTRLGKRLLVIYVVIYVLELITEHWINMPMVSYFKLYPIHDPNFLFFQFATHPFIHDPYAPLGFALNCLVFYFFSRPVEEALGTKRFLILFYISALGGAVLGYAFSVVAGFNTPFLGMLPSLLALVVVFGFLNPEATILLMFILPIKAKYLSYGTILITVLTLLAKVNPHGAYHLGGILFGYIYFKGPKNLFMPGSLRMKYLEWQLKRRRSRFRVINGSKGDDDPPTIH